MAKHIIKKTRRKLRWNSVVTALFIFSLLLSFMTAVFVRAENNRLSRSIQSIQQEISTKQIQNESLSAEVKGLQSRDRVISMAEAAGLEQRDNIMTIKGD